MSPISSPPPSPQKMRQRSNIHLELSEVLRSTRRVYMYDVRGQFDRFHILLRAEALKRTTAHFVVPLIC